MKTLVLAEKPSVGKELARVLGAKNKAMGYFEGNGYVVTWALGHLVGLAEPEDYDKKYQKWEQAHLPIIPETTKFEILKGSGKQYNVIKGLLQRQDISKIVIATDAGREGELVARLILNKAKNKKPCQRLYISSQTDKAIKEGFANLKPSSQYDNLYYAALCRAEADWLIGLNVTRALTTKHNASLSAGRVQSPTLKMIVDREKEIEGFVSKPLYNIKAKCKGLTFNFSKGSFEDESKAKALADELSGLSAEVISTKSEDIWEQPPLLYDLTELQREANRRYSFSAKQTLDITQALYERHKLLTYPRTDSRYISDDMVSSIKDRLKAISYGNYSLAVREILKRPIKSTKRFVDNSKVTDHHAIIPTEESIGTKSLTSDERKIYELVVTRFLEILSGDSLLRKTVITIKANDNKLTYSQSQVISKGHRMVAELLGGKSAEDSIMPSFAVGEKVRLDSITLDKTYTTPPPRYNEATLLYAMEHPMKDAEDQYKEILDKTSGLGTPATRADIIEKLFDSFYVERKGKEIVPTAKGRAIIDLAPDVLCSPTLTGQWEKALYEISIGKKSKDFFIKEIREHTKKLVAEVLNSDATFKHENVSRVKCDSCGKYMLDVKGKKGNMLICPDRDCGHRKKTSQVTNARCPQCHKKLELKGEGEGKIFVCKCGYREKLSSFQKRREDNPDKADKKTIKEFLKKEDEPINDALKEALLKWKKS